MIAKANPTLPVAIEAEAALIGCGLLRMDEFSRAAETVSVDDFTDGDHREVFKVLLGMMDRGEPTHDPTIVRRRLIDAGIYDRIGGMDRLMSFMAEVGSPIGAPHYAKMIAEAARRRKLLTTLEREADRLAGGDDLRDVAERLRAEATFGNDAGSAVNLERVWTEGVANGFGFDGLDLQFLCDLRVTDQCPLVAGRGLLTLIGGLPAKGKSALAESIAFDLLMNNPDARAVLVNVELTPAVLLARQVCRVSGWGGQPPLNPTAILRGVLSDHQRLRRDECFNELRPCLSRLTILDGCSDWPTIRRTVEAVKPDLLVVDYVQRIVAKPGAEQRENINALMTELRIVANAGTAVIAVSALNRAGGATIGAFRESGELEYGADFAAILTDNSEGPILRIVKNRYGVCGDFDATFDGSRLTWHFGRAIHG